jgi:cytochrome d ubiquinol oxidase subunit I
MRTRNAVSNHSALALSTSLILFIVMYFAVFGTGVSYMLKLVAEGPQPFDDHPPPVKGQSLRPSRPLSAAPDDIDPAVDLTGQKEA